MSQKAWAEGEAKGRTTVLSDVAASVCAAISSKFGQIPAGWVSMINAVSSPGKLVGLALTSQSCATPEEFEAQLRLAAGK